MNQAVALLQDYDHHADIYKPNVARSKLVSRNGDEFQAFLRFSMKKVITVVVNTENEARFTRQGPIVRRAASTARALRRSTIPTRHRSAKSRWATTAATLAAEQLLAFSRTRRRDVSAMRGDHADARDSDGIRLDHRTVRDQHSARVAGLHARDHPQSPGAARCEVKALTRRRGGPQVRLPVRNRGYFSPTGWMLTVAAEIDLLSCLLAVLAAVLPEGAMRLDHMAHAGRMGAFRGCGHWAPPERTLRPPCPDTQARPGVGASARASSRLRLTRAIRESC